LAETREAWQEMLDELDRQLVRSHPEFGLGNSPSGIWEMDDLRASFGELGTIPESLVPRAQRILATYADAFDRINAARRIVGDHLVMLQSIKGAQTATPVYFDRVA
jgi:hypothetical protein